MKVRILLLGLAAASMPLAACGDDSGDDDDDDSAGSSGAAYVAARDALVDLGCDCFSQLGYASAGACIDDIGFASREIAACWEDSIDATPGTDTVFACLTDAFEAGTRCLERDGCAGAAACASTLEGAQEACPVLSPAVETSFEATLRECTGGGVGSDECPGQTSNAGFGDTIEGSTTGLADDFEYTDTSNANCDPHGQGAPDVVIRWTAPVAGRYTFLLNDAGTTFNAVMRPITSCTDLTTNVCAEVPNGVNFQTAEMGPLPEGAQITFVIDGATAGQAGDFVIDVSETE